MRPADPRVSRARRLAWVIPLLGFVALAGPRTAAHKGMKSPYTYNEHVFPILRDRCGACHFEGGPTPMSLLSYDAALPWAEAIREQLVREAMPPSYVDPTGPAMKGGHTISPNELDILLMWAGGGAPLGDPSKTPGSVPPPPQWKLGKPDLVIAVDAEHSVPAETSEETAQFVLSTGLTKTRWVKAVDILPGARSMVRDAVVQIDGGPVLTLWGPGVDATPAPDGAAFRLPAAAKVRLTIHYKKNYRDKDIIGRDRSRVGLYFADPPAAGRSIQSLELRAEDPEGEMPQAAQLSAGAQTAGRILAIRPIIDDRHYASIAVDAVLPTGRRPLLLLRSPRPDWPRRYWLAEPIEFPPGTKIEAIAILASPEADDVPSLQRHALQVAVDFIEK